MRTKPLPVKQIKLFQFGKNQHFTLCNKGITLSCEFIYHQTYKEIKREYKSDNGNISGPLYEKITLYTSWTSD